MRHFTLFGLIAVISTTAVFVACGTDEDNIVRLRSDGGEVDGATDAPTDGPGAGFLSCGVAVPGTYESPNIETNAKAELDLKVRLVELDTKMSSAEGAGTAAVTSEELRAAFTAGTPNLRSIATAAAQSTVDDFITQFGDAVGKTWQPSDADAEGGAAHGGKFENASIVSPIGFHLREGIRANLVGGALYNYALSIAGGPLTEATIDRFVVLFGLSPRAAGGTDGGAGEGDKDDLAAEYASKRDDKGSSKLGPYRKVRGALLVAKAAAAGGEKCRADLDSALATYFREWERASYLTVIYFLHQAATYAQAAPVKGPQALQSFGEALGIIQSFRGIPQDRRKITDNQIDALLQRVGASAPYQLLTRTSERVVAFNTAFQDVGVIFDLTQTDIENAKKAY